MRKNHFHSLEALRFFAFLKVYLLHIPLQGDFPIFSFLKGGGGLGVWFFFVLSGFLITYLLVFEKNCENGINLKRFFLRRSLRIWPLFYLIVIIAFLLPYDFKQTYGLHMMGGGYDFDWKYSFSFLENYKMLLLDNSPKTTPLSVFWSLCIEEHFYFLWMISLFIIPLKHILKFLIFCIILSWIARFFEPYIWGNNMVNTSDLFTNLDFFAFGGLLGYFVAMDYNKVSNFILKINNWFKWFFIILVLLTVVFQNDIVPNSSNNYIQIFRSSIFALLFTLLIAIFIPEESKIKIKNKLLSYLGTISYGLYVFHLIFVHIVFQYCINNNIIIDNWITLSAFIIVTLGGTIVLSSLSYKYYESYFLSIREKISKYLSR